MNMKLLSLFSGAVHCEVESAGKLELVVQFDEPMSLRHFLNLVCERCFDTLSHCADVH